MGDKDQVAVTYSIIVMAQPAPGGKVDESFQTTPATTDGTFRIPAVHLALGDQAVRKSINSYLNEAVNKFVPDAKQVVDAATCRLETVSKLLPDTAVLLAAKYAADAAYKDSVSQLVDQYDPIDDDTFWGIIVLLQKRLVNHGAVDIYVKRSVDNIIWDMVCGSEPGGMAGWELACGFLHRYRSLVDELSIRYEDMAGLDKGDDGRGDFFDSLPLAGRTLVEALLDESQPLTDYGTLHNAMWRQNTTADLRDMICEGENYIRMAVEEKIHDYFGAVADKLNRVKCGVCGHECSTDELYADGGCVDCKPFDIDEED